MSAALMSVIERLAAAIATRVASALVERLEPIVASAVERCVAARLAASTGDAVADELNGPATERMHVPHETSHAGAEVGVAPMPSTLRSSGIVSVRPPCAYGLLRTAVKAPDAPLRRVASWEGNS